MARGPSGLRRFPVPLLLTLPDGVGFLNHGGSLRVRRARGRRVILTSGPECVHASCSIRSRGGFRSRISEAIADNFDRRLIAVSSRRSNTPSGKLSLWLRDFTTGGVRQRLGRGLEVEAEGFPPFERAVALVRKRFPSDGQIQLYLETDPEKGDQYVVLELSSARNPASDSESQMRYLEEWSSSTKWPASRMILLDVRSVDQLGTD